MSAKTEELYRCNLCGRANFFAPVPHKAKPGSKNPWCPAKTEDWEHCGGLTGGGTPPEPFDLPASATLRAPSAPSALNPVSVLTAEHAAAVDRAKAYYAGIRTSGQQMGIYGFLFGHQLLALKETEHGQHGRWMQFCADNFPDLKTRMINYFMEAAAKFALSANLPTVGIKLLADGSLPKPVEKQILEAWHEHADGKFVTKFLRESGAIRDKKPQAYTPPKPLTEAEQLEAQLTQLQSFFAGALENLTLIRDLDAGDLGIIPRDQWQMLLDACVPAAKLARSLLRKSRQTKPRKATKAK